MSNYYQEFSEKLSEVLGEIQYTSEVNLSELTITIDKKDLLEVSKTLRDNEICLFDTLIDVCGIDYSQYEGAKNHPSRYASVYHLLSVSLNHRIRVVTYLDNNYPRVDSVMEIWRGADWFERESFDMLGILYDGHPDLRRILTDYGFIGHPFRKDFPMIGNVEMRYDEDKKRVVYEPVSIENRVVVPRTIKDDNRYQQS